MKLFSNKGRNGINTKVIGVINGEGISTRRVRKKRLMVQKSIRRDFEVLEKTEDNGAVLDK